MGRLVILVLRELEMDLLVLLAALLLSLSELTACFCCCYGTALLLERVRAFACAAAAASLPKLPHHAIAHICPAPNATPPANTFKFVPPKRYRRTADLNRLRLIVKFERAYKYSSRLFESLL